MINYSNYHEAVIGLHERGFSEDFVLFGNDLLWVQEKLLLQQKIFLITECHHVNFPIDNMEDPGDIRHHDFLQKCKGDFDESLFFLLFYPDGNN